MNKVTCIIILLIISIVMCGCGCEHEFEEATCTSKSYCIKCGCEKGEYAKHKYYGPMCIECLHNNPKFDLKNVGFTNQHGMNCWIPIKDYDYSFVDCISLDRGEKFEVLFFGDGYFEKGTLTIEELKNQHFEPLTSDMLADKTVTQCEYINNDCISHKSGFYDLTIKERYILEKYNNIVVIKISRSTGIGDVEELYVPAALLNFNKSAVIGSKILVSGNYEYDISK